MELSKKYKIIKKMLDEKLGIDFIVECTGLSEMEILDFFNGDYKYIRQEEKLQAFHKAPGKPIAIINCYDGYCKIKK